MIVLYSTHCPKCEVLRKKLNMKKVQYELVTDVDVMTEKGFMSAPMLEVDGKYYDFKKAIEYIEELD